MGRNGNFSDKPIPSHKSEVVKSCGRPKIELSRKRLDFRAVLLSQSAEQNLTITNTGNAFLVISSIIFADSASSQFAEITTASWSKRLAPLASTTMGVRFTAKRAGAAVGMLQIRSNADNQPLVDLELRAEVFALENPKSPQYLASGAEDIELSYTVRDASKAIESGWLEIQDANESLIFRRALESFEYADGPQTISFNGAIGVRRGYPDGFLTVEHSPYSWRVIAVVAGCPDAAIVEHPLNVEVAAIKLELGPKDVLKKSSHQAAYDTLEGSLPDKCTTKRLLLPSNVFTTKSLERGDSNDTSFVEYRKLWGEGPLVPIYAKLLVKDSNGDEKAAPEALGDVPVLWDYEDLPKDNSGLHAQAKKYVSEAQTYSTTDSIPPGDGCHERYGGKRGKPSKAMFPHEHSISEVDGFPFALPVTLNKRAWAVYTKPERHGIHASKTGVLFRPSRMAGETYAVHAYVDPGRQGDHPGELSLPLHAETGTFEIWRRVDVIKVFRKTENVTVYDHGEVKKNYEKAYIDLNDASGGSELIPDYNDRFRRAITKVGGPLAEHGLKNPQEPVTEGDCALFMVEPAQFKNAYCAPDNAAIRARIRANEDFYNEKRKTDSWDNLQVYNHARQAVIKERLQWLKTNGYWHNEESVTKSNYTMKCSHFSKLVTLCACNDVLKDVAGEGIVIFQFAWLDNFTRTLRGIAMDQRHHLGTNYLTRTKASYIQGAPKAFYQAPESMDQTVAHEIGHLLFLPHTMREGEWSQAHDDADEACLMGYNFTVRRNFCGYCLLRLRGWDHTKLSSCSSKNVKQPTLEEY